MSRESLMVGPRRQPSPRRHVVAAKRDIVKLAKAEANGSGGWGASGFEGSGKRDAAGVEQDGTAHHKYVCEKAHQGAVVFKGDAPRVRVTYIDHG